MMDVVDELADVLPAILAGLRRLKPSSRDPERYHIDKDGLERDLAKAIETLKGAAMPRFAKTPLPSIRPGTIAVGRRMIVIAVRGRRAA